MRTQLTLRRILALLCLCLAAVVNGLGQEAALNAVDENMINVEYPYPVAFLPLTIQGETLNMAYMDVKPQRANGHTVMLLHGKNFPGAYWGQTAQALVSQGFRVIIPDQVGFGKSGKPKRIQYSFQLLAANTKKLLDTLGISQVAVVGHSMGGMLATRFTLMYPGLVEKLVLENPLGLEDWKLKVPYQTVDAWYQGELKQTYSSLKKYQQENYYGGEWRPAYDRWLNMQAGWTLDSSYPKLAWNSALTYEMIFTQPVVYEFEKITTPTLLIIGQSDRTALGKQQVAEAIRKTLGNYPELGRQAAKKIKGSVLVEIPNTGHLPHVQSFEPFIKSLVDFLAPKASS